MLTFWAYLRFHLLLWSLRAAWRVIRWLVTAAVLITAAPVTVVATVAYTGAWLRGWPPVKLWRAAAWALPMTGVYLAGRALQAATWHGLAYAPVHDWERACPRRRSPRSRRRSPARCSRRRRGSRSPWTACRPRTYLSPLMTWLDTEHIGYLAWTWNNWDCSQGPALITDYAGDATAHGAGYQAHLVSLAVG